METRNSTFQAGAAARALIECDHGSITVRSGPPGSVTVSTAFRRADLFDYTAESDGETVHVRARMNAPLGGLAALFSWPKPGPRADIVVVVPHDASVTARSSNAPADIEGVRGGVDVRVSNGQVTLTRCRGTVVVHATNGAVNVSSLEGRIELHATNGAIRGRDIAGAIQARTTNGRIDLEVDPEPGSSGSVRSTNGAVSVGLVSMDVALSVSTKHGSTEIDVPPPANPGPRQASLDVRTTNGSVRVYQSAPVTMRF